MKSIRAVLGVSLIIIINQQATAKKYLQNKQKADQKKEFEVNKDNWFHDKNEKQSKVNMNNHKPNSVFSKTIEISKPDTFRKSNKDKKDKKKKLPKELQKIKKRCDMKLKQTVKPRIVNGTLVPVGEPNLYPWMAAIFVEGQMTNGSKNYPETAFVCGGSLISARYVITAAHCLMIFKDIWKVDPKRILVRLGTKDLSSRNSMEIRLHKYVVHPKFVGNNKQATNDIALFKFRCPVKFTKCIQPICVPLLTTMWAPDKMGQAVMLAGWGRTTGGDDSDSVVNLRHGVAHIVEMQKCVDQFNPIKMHTNSTICINKLQLNMTTICTGDSGGPVIPFDLTKNQELPILIGVNSFGRPGCRGLSISTKVAPYHNWIRKVIDGFENSKVKLQDEC